MVNFYDGVKDESIIVRKNKNTFKLLCGLRWAYYHKSTLSNGYIAAMSSLLAFLGRSRMGYFIIFKFLLSITCQNCSYRGKT